LYLVQKKHIFDDDLTNNYFCGILTTQWRHHMAVNYLNNKDLLHEIHLSKKSYCSFLSPKDTNYDLIIGSLEELNSKAISDALANRMERLRKEDGTDLTNVDIPDTELVFRVMTWDHIPKAEKKQKIKTQKTFDEFFDTVDDEEEIDDLVSIENFVARKNHIKLNFAPFAHYRVDSHTWLVSHTGSVILKPVTFQRLTAASHKTWAECLFDSVTDTLLGPTGAVTPTTKKCAVMPFFS